MVGIEFGPERDAALPGVRQMVSLLDDKLKGSLCGFTGASLLRDYATLVAFTEYNRNVIRLEPPLIAGPQDFDDFCASRGTARPRREQDRHAVRPRRGNGLNEWPRVSGALRRAHDSAPESRREPRIHVLGELAPARKTGFEVSPAPSAVLGRGKAATASSTMRSNASNSRCNFSPRLGKSSAKVVPSSGNESMPREAGVPNCFNTARNEPMPLAEMVSSRARTLRSACAWGTAHWY